MVNKKSDLGNGSGRITRNQIRIGRKESHGTKKRAKTKSADIVISFRTDFDVRLFDRQIKR